MFLSRLCAAGAFSRNKYALGHHNSAKTQEWPGTVITFLDRVLGRSKSENGRQKCSNSPEIETEYRQTAQENKAPESLRSLSARRVVYTTLTQTLTAGDGNEYLVTVTYDSASGIPSDAELSVSEIREGEAGYDEYVAQSASALGQNPENLAFARPFDITLKNPQTGEEYQPNESVQVSIQLLKDDLNNYSNVDVVHIPDGAGDNAQVMDTTVHGEAVEFAADGFSVYVLVGVPTVAAAAIAENKPFLFANSVGGMQYMTNAVLSETGNPKTSLGKTTSIASASRFYFESVDESGKYYVFTYVNDSQDKSYLCLDAYDGNGANLSLKGEDGRQALTVTEKGGLYSISYKNASNQTHYINKFSDFAGNKFAGWKENNNGSKIRLIDASEGKLSDPLGIDGKSYLIVDNNNRALGTTTQTINGRAGLSFVQVIHDVDNYYYYNAEAGSEPSLWTFSANDSGAYAVYTVVDGDQKYLNIANSTTTGDTEYLDLTLGDEPEYFTIDASYNANGKSVVFFGEENSVRLYKNNNGYSARLRKKNAPDNDEKFTLGQLKTQGMIVYEYAKGNGADDTGALTTLPTARVYQDYAENRKIRETIDTSYQSFGKKVWTYTLKYWVDASGSQYNPGDEVTLSEGQVLVLTPVWTVEISERVVSVIYKSGYEIDSLPQPYEINFAEAENTQYTIQDIDQEDYYYYNPNDGKRYLFTGWKSDSNQAVAAGAEIDLSETVYYKNPNYNKLILTAQWTTAFSDPWGLDEKQAVLVNKYNDNYYSLTNEAKDSTYLSALSVTYDAGLNICVSDVEGKTPLLWRFTANDNGTYYILDENGKYLNIDNTNNVKVTDTPKDITILYSDALKRYFFMQGNKQLGYNVNNQRFGAQQRTYGTKAEDQFILADCGNSVIYQYVPFDGDGAVATTLTASDQVRRAEEEMTVMAPEQDVYYAFTDSAMSEGYRYNFYCWEDSEGKEYYPGATLSITDGAVLTLRSVWTPENAEVTGIYSVTNHLNGERLYLLSGDSYYYSAAIAYVDAQAVALSGTGKSYTATTTPQSINGAFWVNEKGALSTENVAYRKDENDADIAINIESVTHDYEFFPTYSQAVGNEIARAGTYNFVVAVNDQWMELERPFYVDLYAFGTGNNERFAWQSAYLKKVYEAFYNDAYMQSGETNPEYSDRVFGYNGKNTNLTYNYAPMDGFVRVFQQNNGDNPKYIFYTPCIPPDQRVSGSDPINFNLQKSDANGKLNLPAQSFYTITLSEELRAEYEESELFNAANRISGTDDEWGTALPALNADSFATDDQGKVETHNRYTFNNRAVTVKVSAPQKYANTDLSVEADTAPRLMLVSVGKSETVYIEPEPNNGSGNTYTYHISADKMTCPFEAKIITRDPLDIDAKSRMIVNVSESLSVAMNTTGGDNKLASDVVTPQNDRYDTGANVLPTLWKFEVYGDGNGLYTIKQGDRYLNINTGNGNGYKNLTLSATPQVFYLKAEEDGRVSIRATAGPGAYLHYRGSEFKFQGYYSNQTTQPDSSELFYLALPAYDIYYTYPAAENLAEGDDDSVNNRPIGYFGAVWQEGYTAAKPRTDTYTSVGSGRYVYNFNGWKLAGENDHVVKAGELVDSPDGLAVFEAQWLYDEDKNSEAAVVRYIIEPVNADAIKQDYPLPTIEQSHDYSDFVTSPLKMANYPVKALDGDKPFYKTYTGDREQNQFTYAFAGWKDENDKIHDTGDILNLTELDDSDYSPLDKNHDGVITLTATWNDTYSDNAKRKVFFYVNIKAVSSQANKEESFVISTSDGDFTYPAFNTLMDYKEGNAPQVFNYTSDNKWAYPIVNFHDLKQNDTVAYDKVFPHIGDYTKEKGYGIVTNLSDANAAVRRLSDDVEVMDPVQNRTQIFKLLEFPSDEQILSFLRDNFNKSNSKRNVTLDGESVDPDTLTTKYYTINWYVCKYMTSNGGEWHIDGMLTPKASYLTVRKVFSGDEDALAKIEKNNPNGVIEGHYYIHAENTNKNTDYGKRNQFTLVLAPESEINKLDQYDPDDQYTYDHGLRGYDEENSDPDNHTYVWSMRVRANSNYAITEHNYEVSVGNKQFGVAAQWNMTHAGEDGSTTTKQWISDLDSFSQLVNVDYLKDEITFEDRSLLNLYNNYVEKGTFMIHAVGLIPNGTATPSEKDLANTYFQVLDSEGKPLPMTRTGNGQYTVELKESGSTDVTVEAATDARGRLYLKMPISVEEQRTFTIVETVPMGYMVRDDDLQPSLVVTVDTNGAFEISNTTKPKGGSISSLTSGAVGQASENVTGAAIKNASEKVRVQVSKVWIAPTIKKANDVTVQLSGKIGSRQVYTAQAKLSESNDWIYVWDNLPKYFNNNIDSLIEYTVAETRIGNKALRPSDDEWIVNYDYANEKPEDTAAGGGLTVETEDEDDSTIYCTVTNTYVNGISVNLKKVSSAEGASALDHYSFILYQAKGSDEGQAGTIQFNGEDIPYSTSETISGKKMNLNLGQTYYIVEAQAPVNYVKKKGFIKIDVDEENASVTLTPENGSDWVVAEQGANCIYSPDSGNALRGTLTLKNDPAICRIVDGGEEITFATLHDAMDYAKDMTTSDISIEMLVDYVMPKEDSLTGDYAIQDKNITLTTAKSGRNYYMGTDNAIITRDFDTRGSMFAVKAGTFAVEKIALDGNNKKDSDTETEDTLSGIKDVQTRGEYQRGGIIRVESGVLNIKDGALLKNGKARKGGGVYAYGGTTVNVYGGAVIENCEATENGGGIYTERINGKNDDNRSRNPSHGLLNLKGTSDSKVTIQNCKAGSDGGAVYVMETYFTAQHTEIKDNTAANMGGGLFINTLPIYCWSKVDAELSDIVVTGNVAKEGGGICSYNRSKLTISGDSEISENTASMDAGGIRMGEQFLMTGGTVKDNAATRYGGGFRSNNGTVGNIAFDDTSIIGNTATEGGGGYANFITLRNGVEVTGNYSTKENAQKAIGDATAGAGMVVTGRLTLGGEGISEETTNISGNHTKTQYVEADSNLCLTRTKNNVSYNAPQNISLLSKFEGKIYVSNPGDAYTQFGIANNDSYLDDPVDVNSASGETLVQRACIAADDGSALIGRMGKNMGGTEDTNLYWWKKPTAKITDPAGDLLYIKSGENLLPAVFAFLYDPDENYHDATGKSYSYAFSLLNNDNPQLYYSNGSLYRGTYHGTDVNYCVKMLDDYHMREIIKLEGSKKIVFTTAGTDIDREDGYPYLGVQADGHALIKRDKTAAQRDNCYMFCIRDRVDLTFTNITLDGGAVFNPDGSLDTVNSITVDIDGTFANLFNQAILRIADGATLQNSYSVYDNKWSAGAICHGYWSRGTSLYMTGGKIYRCGVRTDGGAIGTHTTKSYTEISGGEIVDCWAGRNGGAVYMKNANNRLVIKGGTIKNCTAANGGGIYLDGDAKMSIQGELNYSGNYSTDAAVYAEYADKTNGGSSANYAGNRAPSDIFVHSMTGNPAQTITLTEDINAANGSVWVWIENTDANPTHHKNDDQFAVVGDDLTVSQDEIEDWNFEDKTIHESMYKVFRNARDDEATNNLNSEYYLTGHAGDPVDGKVCVYWGPATDGYTIAFRKIDGAGNSLTDATFTMYLANDEGTGIQMDGDVEKVYQISGAAATAASGKGTEKDHAAGTNASHAAIIKVKQDTADNPEVVDKAIYDSGLVVFEQIPEGVYFLKETVTPILKDANGNAIAGSEYKAVEELYKVVMDGKGFFDIYVSDGYNGWITAPHTTFVKNGDAYTAATGEVTEGDTVEVYTVLNASPLTRKVILKKADGADYKPLPGAKLTVYYADKQTVVKVDGKDKDGNDIKVPLDKLESGNGGAYYIGKLPYGTYYMEETTVPDDYVEPDKLYEFKVDADGVKEMKESASSFTLTNELRPNASDVIVKPTNPGSGNAGGGSGSEDGGTPSGGSSGSEGGTPSGGGSGSEGSGTPSGGGSGSEGGGTPSGGGSGSEGGGTPSGGGSGSEDGGTPSGGGSGSEGGGTPSGGGSGSEEGGTTPTPTPTKDMWGDVSGVETTDSGKSIEFTYSGEIISGNHAFAWPPALPIGAANWDDVQQETFSINAGTLLATEKGEMFYFMEDRKDLSKNQIPHLLNPGVVVPILDNKIVYSKDTFPGEKIDNPQNKDVQTIIYYDPDIPKVWLRVQNGGIQKPTENSSNWADVTDMFFDTNQDPGTQNTNQPTETSAPATTPQPTPDPIAQAIEQHGFYLNETYSYDGAKQYSVVFRNSTDQKVDKVSITVKTSGSVIEIGGNVTGTVNDDGTATIEFANYGNGLEAGAQSGAIYMVVYGKGEFDIDYPDN